ncbi:phosphate acetyltransferase [Georgenia deserti]|uniref:Phosphate acetyltransferase n=1 Tax=Georgenia deserti TaxID=2093781 RepID=A0ABW4L2I0_9MICO
MGRSIYIASSEGHTGKSAIALGLVQLFAARVESVGVFRPVTRSRSGRDTVVELLLDQGLDLAYDDALAVTYDDVHADADGALSRIVDAFPPVAREHEVTIVVGSDYTDVAAPAELAFNARVAANLGAPVLLVVSGVDRTAEEIVRVVEASTAEIAHEHARTVGVVVNRCPPDLVEEVRGRLSAEGRAAWVLPEVPLLSAPTVRDLLAALDGDLLLGDEALLDREAEHMLVAGMNTEHILERLHDGQLCIAAADRPEVLVTLVAAHASDQYPTLAGIVLNGRFRPPEQVLRMVEGLGQRLPIMTTPHDTYPTASLVARTRGTFSRGTQRKRDIALALFEEHVDSDRLLAALEVPVSEVVTPLMFESRLIERARESPRHIVLPEGDDDRILRAASTLLSRRVAELTLLGNPTQVRARAAELGLDLDGAEVIDPATSDLLEDFAGEYARLRAHKGMTVERAREVVQDVSYFGTMMVHTGAAHGMVSGAAHTTAHTIRPSFEIIKTSPGTSIVSSVFFMCLADRVLVYGDCAVNPEPTAEQLADIAISSAQTSARFEVTPRVAMLSYSTGESGSGAEVDKVRTATELVRRRRPDLVVEGPIQYDAAVDASVAAAKLPGSDVAGRATVFVFPDLNTGNNTYKAVQRTAGAVAVGPVLQGLNKPVNDLSRGALVRDIVNTVAITAVQSQAPEDGSAA